MHRNDLVMMGDINRTYTVTRNSIALMSISCLRRPGGVPSIDEERTANSASTAPHSYKQQWSALEREPRWGENWISSAAIYITTMRSEKPNSGEPQADSVFFFSSA